MPPRPKLLTKADTANAAKAKAAHAELVKLTKQLAKARAARDRAVSALLKSKAPAWQIEQLTGMPAERIHDLASLMRKAGDV